MHNHREKNGGGRDHDNGNRQISKMGKLPAVLDYDIPGISSSNSGLNDAQASVPTSQSSLLVGDEAMSLGLILVILLVIFLLGGFSGRFGGYGYGYGHGGVGILGTILIIVLVLMLLGRI